jgi:hypothetical protein
MVSITGVLVALVRFSAWSPFARRRGRDLSGSGWRSSPSPCSSFLADQALVRLSTGHRIAMLKRIRLELARTPEQPDGHAG